MNPSHSDRAMTPLSGWLRATNIDELRTLWNIIRGDMSIVGAQTTAHGAPRAILRGSLGHETRRHLSGWRRHDASITRHRGH